MQLFLDSADFEEIQAANATGYLDGLTTNPSLVSKTGRSYDEIARELTEIVDGEVSLEVIATRFDDMLAEGRRLAAINDNVVVKLPTTPDGIRACSTLSSEGIRVNMTLIFSPVQALLAAKAGAYYASLFVGRLDDSGADGEEVVLETREIFDIYNYETKILFASIRTLEHIKNAALLGCDIATIPHNVFQQMHAHPMTDAGLEKFLEDYRNVS